MRKGSALLIVIGVMTFMVVSALAFSMFMRQNRLPSSFLRQKIAARGLVKAALADAMRRLDIAVGDNPYPGVGQGGTVRSTVEFRDGTVVETQNGNFWQNRVLLESKMAFDTVGTSDDHKDALQYDTQATLTLEGLAYLPPPLINTVRYWSRRTSTASWYPIGYDAGRYCFTAVNVSDHLDVTRIKANAMRDSTAEGRLSLGFLFDGGAAGEKGANDSSGAASFDTFIAASTNDAFRTRFVSLADFNLALGSGVYGDAGLRSPFFDYVDNAPQDGSFYGARRDQAKIMRFVTDSWYPAGFTNRTARFLSDGTGQPFGNLGDGASLSQLGKTGGDKNLKDYLYHVDFAALAALYDYLDEDSVPISLAVPTVERTPMLTGLTVASENFGITLKHDKSGAESTTVGNLKTTREFYTWRIDKLGSAPKIVVRACGVYPFKRGFRQPDGGFTFEVLVRGFFATFKADSTRLLNGKGAAKDIGASWSDGQALSATDKAWFTVAKTAQAIKLPNTAPLKDSDTVFNIPESGSLELFISPSMADGCPVYGILKETKENLDTGSTSTTYAFSDEKWRTENKRLCYYTDANGTISKTYGKTGPELYLNLYAFARIVDSRGKTVDLVPAVISDDQTYNGFNSEGVSELSAICGRGTPVIPAHTEKLTEFTEPAFIQAAKDDSDDVAGLPKQADVQQASLDIYCDDPRYNYAPEDWYQVVAAAGAARGVDKEVWLAAARGRCNGSDHRPHDLFQFVSDCGYDALQSLGELQFLPYTRAFADNRSPTDGDFYRDSKYSGTPFSTRLSAGSCANQFFAWKTHWAFGEDADCDDGQGADPYEWGILDTKGGPTVNPYADTSLMKAALVNTPYDWAVAYGDHGLSLGDGKKYCFCDSSSEAPMDAQDIADIAAHIKARIGTNLDWERIWRDELDWDTEKFLGTTLGREDLHDVDRKYLYSYWRSCFGNSQQLYLVFVRAEPAVMSGDTAGHTPAQLGARAVALVWREPTASLAASAGANSGGSRTPGGTTPTSKMHRMRILFYKQME